MLEPVTYRGKDAEEVWSLSNDRRKRVRKTLKRKKGIKIERKDIINEPKNAVRRSMRVHSSISAVRNDAGSISLSLMLRVGIHILELLLGSDFSHGPSHCSLGMPTRGNKLLYIYAPINMLWHLKCFVRLLKELFSSCASSWITKYELLHTHKTFRCCQLSTFCSLHI
jgi:hypothetical protein